MTNDNTPKPEVPVKTALIVDEAYGAFSLEYDDTRGRKQSMRLDALTYEGALREARSFLGIPENDQSEAGDGGMMW